MLSKLQSDLAVLDELIARMQPLHRSERTTPQLEDDAPAALAALWRTVGVSPAIVRPPYRPQLTRAASAKAVEEAGQEFLANARARDRLRIKKGDFHAIFDALPKKYRIVSREKWEFAYTDESGADEDPPVYAFTVDDGVVRWHGSYLAWATWMFLSGLSTFRTSSYFTVDGEDYPGKQLLSTIDIRLAQLGPDVYRITMPDVERTDVVPADTDFVFYPGMGKYMAFLRSLSDAALRHFAPPSGHFIEFAPNAASAPKALEAEGFRVVAMNDGFIALGKVDGHDVHLTQAHPTQAVITIDPRHGDVAKKWAAKHGRIAFEQPLPPNFAEQGWE